MAYQKVGTPRFYIDLPSYITSMGGEIITNSDKKLFNLDPNTTKVADFSEPYDTDVGDNMTGYPTGQNGLEVEFHDEIKNLCNVESMYIALLNFNKKVFQYKVHGDDVENILNSNFAGSGGVEGHRIQVWDKGCSISIFKSDSFELERLKNKFRLNNLIDINSEEQMLSLDVGCISFGSYYDMPQSPELDITMEIEFDGFDTIKTLGGATMTNVRYAGSPWWYDVDGNKAEPWAVGESSATTTKRNGRRTWNMKFNYLDEKDLFSSNYTSSDYMSNLINYSISDIEVYDGRSHHLFNINNDDSFVSQVLNKVGNGQRFIFQPNNTANNPSDFAIAMLDQDSLQIKQVANGVYDISLKITEVW